LVSRGSACQAGANAAAALILKRLESQLSGLGAQWRFGTPPFFNLKEQILQYTTRRIFMVQLAAGSTVLAASRAMAQAAPPKLEEKDPLAVALGYAHDTAKVDKKKFPKHMAQQACSNCQLFMAKGKDPLGGCSLFPGKQVASAGWCSAYVKKA